MFDPYVFALALGGTGLLAMAVMGGHARVGARAHPGHAAPHGGSHHGASHHGGAHHASGARSVLSRWSVLLSPRVAFSVLVGFGGVGLALKSLLAGPWLFAVAVIGGIGFEAAVVGPSGTSCSGCV